MENPEENKKSETPDSESSDHIKRVTQSGLLWDCGSTLYDSFELNSLTRQIENAIAVSRTEWIPHLYVPNHHNHHPRRRLYDPCNHSLLTRSSSKVSRSFQKIFRSVLRNSKSDNNSNSVSSESREEISYKVGDGAYDVVVYNKRGIFSTIQEVPEFETRRLSPEINASVRKTASERFPVNIIEPSGLPCS